MSYSNGVDPMHLRQLRAMAENLCTLANRHRENHNYVVAHALYGRALSVAQEIHTSGNDGDVLVARIRADQQAVFEILRSGKSVSMWPAVLRIGFKPVKNRLAASMGLANTSTVVR